MYIPHAHIVLSAVQPIAPCSNAARRQSDLRAIRESLPKRPNQRERALLKPRYYCCGNWRATGVQSCWLGCTFQLDYLDGTHIQIWSPDRVGSPRARCISPARDTLHLDKGNTLRCWRADIPPLSLSGRVNLSRTRVMARGQRRRCAEKLCRASPPPLYWASLRGKAH